MEKLFLYVKWPFPMDYKMELNQDFKVGLKELKRKLHLDKLVVTN